MQHCKFKLALGWNINTCYLNGLAQPHLVCEDAVQGLLVHEHQPVEPDHLVVCQGEAFGDGLRLLVQLHAHVLAGRQVLHDLLHLVCDLLALQKKESMSKSGMGVSFENEKS